MRLQKSVGLDRSAGNVNHLLLLAGEMFAGLLNIESFLSLFLTVSL